MAGLFALTMGIIYGLPKITKAFPAPLVATLIVFGLTQFLNIETCSVGDMSSIAGSLPKFSLPTVSFTFEALKIILPYSFVLAGVGLIESLLTLNLIDEITQTKARNSQECVAQGSANIVTGFFGGMGCCAMIGHSMINITSAAGYRWSGIAARLFLISFILFGSSLIERIPLAALTGVIFSALSYVWESSQHVSVIAFVCDIKVQKTKTYQLYGSLFFW